MSFLSSLRKEYNHIHHRSWVILVVINDHRHQPIEKWNRSWSTSVSKPFECNSWWFMNVFEPHKVNVHTYTIWIYSYNKKKQRHHLSLSLFHDTPRFAFDNDDCVVRGKEHYYIVPYKWGFSMSSYVLVLLQIYLFYRKQKKHVRKLLGFFTLTLCHSLSGYYIGVRKKKWE